MPGTVLGNCSCIALDSEPGPGEGVGDGKLTAVLVVGLRDATPTSSNGPEIFTFELASELFELKLLILMPGATALLKLRFGALGLVCIGVRLTLG